MAEAPRFLTADWLNLAMLNYEIDPAVLVPRLPEETELDLWEGRALVSVVGFQFLDTRVLGLPVPFHRSFEEVNLRFYVRRRVADGWRRGVAFVKEIVPRLAIAWVANAVYQERYVALPMRHAVEPGEVRYEWCRHGAWEGLAAAFRGEPALPAEGSEEAFLTEHYWGYAAEEGMPALEYRVEHPRWRVWRAEEATLHCDAAALYGPEFAEALAKPPRSALVAEGSRVTVHMGNG